MTSFLPGGEFDPFMSRMSADKTLLISMRAILDEQLGSTKMRLSTGYNKELPETLGTIIYDDTPIRTKLFGADSASCLSLHSNSNESRIGNRPEYYLTADVRLQKGKEPYIFEEDRSFLEHIYQNPIEKNGEQANNYLFYGYLIFIYPEEQPFAINHDICDWATIQIINEGGIENPTPHQLRDYLHNRNYRPYTLNAVDSAELTHLFGEAVVEFELTVDDILVPKVPITNL